jgi:hypothetical protein
MPGWPEQFSKYRQFCEDFNTATSKYWKVAAQNNVHIPPEKVETNNLEVIQAVWEWKNARDTRWAEMMKLGMWKEVRKEQPNTYVNVH